jgi:hypothetical protein
MAEDGEIEKVGIVFTPRRAALNDRFPPSQPYVASAKLRTMHLQRKAETPAQSTLGCHTLNDRNADEPAGCTCGKSYHPDHYLAKNASLQSGSLSRKWSFGPPFMSQIGTGRSLRQPQMSQLRTLPTMIVSSQVAQPI